MKLITRTCQKSGRALPARPLKPRGQPPSACTSASTADATPDRSPELVNTSAVTFGEEPAAGPVTTNRTEPNRPASASAAARGAAPAATTTLQPLTSSDPANGSA